MSKDEPTNDNVEEVVPDQSQPTEAPEQQPEPVETPAEQPVEDQPEPEVPPEQPQEVDTPEVPEERPPSRREQKRVRDLLQRYPELDNRQPAPSQNKDRLDYTTAFDPETPPEVVKQFEDDRRKAEEAQYKAGLEQSNSIQFHTRLEIDAPKVESRYPELNPSSPEFDAEAADDINTLYLYLTGYDAKTGRVANPNLRYADFVESQMGLSERLASKKNVESAKNIAKQAATTGLRPDGSSAKRLNLNQAPEDMTMEELYAKIGQTPPKPRK